MSNQQPSIIRIGDIPSNDDSPVNETLATIVPFSNALKKQSNFDKLVNDHLLYIDYSYPIMSYLTSHLKNVIIPEKDGVSIVVNMKPYDKNLFLAMNRSEQRDIINKAHNSGYKKLITALKNGEKHPIGTPHLNAIRTLVERVIPSLLNDPSKCKNINGPTQSGKSSLAHIMSWLEPIMCLMTGRKYFNINVGTNKLAHGSQYREELDVFLDLFGDVEFEYAKSEIAYKSSRVSLNQLRKLNNDAIDRMCKSYNEYQLSFKENVEDGGNEYLKSVFVARTNKLQCISDIQQLCQNADLEGFDLLYLVDEHHYGADTDSILYQIMSIHNTDGNNLASENSNHIWIGFSATAYDFNHLEKIDNIKQFLGDNYCGFNVLQGDIYDTDAAVINPVLYTFDEAAKIYDCEGLQHINIKLLSNKSKYNKKPQFIGGEKLTHDEYYTYCMNAVDLFITNVLLDGNGDNDKTLMLMRWHHSNAITDIIENYIVNTMGIKVINFRITPSTTKKDKETSIAKRIENEVGNEKAIILVTGNGRMADSFPICVKYYVDFTETIGSQAAFIQGTLGRSTGYGKQSVVFMNRKNIGAIRAYAIEGFYSKHPTKNLKLGDKVGNSKPIINMAFNRYGNLFDHQPIIDTFQSIVAKYLSNDVSHIDIKKQLASASNKANKLNGITARGYIDLWNIYLPEDVMQTLEDICNSSLLRAGVGHVTENPLKPKFNGEGYDYKGGQTGEPIRPSDIGFRNMTEKDNEKGHMSKRMKDDRNKGGTSGKKPSGLSLAPQIGVKFEDGKWLFVEIELRLKYGSYTQHKTSSTAYLDHTSKSSAVEFMNDDEIQHSILMQGV